MSVASAAVEMVTLAVPDLFGSAVEVAVMVAADCGRSESSPLLHAAAAAVLRPGSGK